jgi:hypothetical protein
LISASPDSISGPWPSIPAAPTSKWGARRINFEARRLYCNP